MMMRKELLCSRQSKNTRGGCVVYIIINSDRGERGVFFCTEGLYYYILFQSEFFAGVKIR